MSPNGNRENQKLLVTLITAMALIVLAMIASVFMVTRRPVVVVIPGGGETGGAAPAAAQPGTTESAAPAAGAPLPEVAVIRLPAAPSIDNPLDPAWEQVAAVEIPLQGQQVAEPMLSAPTVTGVRVQSVRDTSRYLWRLSWAQPDPSTSSDFSEFSDAVAIQFPLVDGAPYTMGGPDMPVSILYWRAIWQKDVDEGFQDTVVTRPNAYNDFYWFASQTGPLSADKLAAEDPMAKQWLIAHSSGNPMADFARKCPMEEIRAHGFGTSTHAANPPGQARGRWDQGRWYVVFERPVSEGDQLINRFNQNPQQQLIAFAVWDGQAQNRGGLKSISNWIPMRINP
jgi:Ethylbenzene dehydrogenase